MRSGFITMKIAVISEHPSPTWSSRQIILALESLGVSTLYLKPYELVSVFGEGEYSVLDLHTLKPIDIDGAILRDLGVSLTIENFLRRCNTIKHLELLGKPVVNPVESLIISRDKHLSLLLLAKAGLPVPRTIVLEDFTYIPRIVKTLGRTVIKPLIGGMGFGIVMTDDPDVAYTIARTLTQLKQPIYLQKYIEKPGRDIRILIIGEDTVAAYYRVQTKEGSWKTNVAQGAKPVPIPRLSSELEDLAFKAMKVLNLKYAGIDIAESDDGYFILEVNASPQWRGIQKVTNVNIALHLAKYLVSLVKQ